MTILTKADFAEMAFDDDLMMSGDYYSHDVDDYSTFN